MSDKSNYPSGILIDGFREVDDTADFLIFQNVELIMQMTKLYTMFTVPYIVVADAPVNPNDMVLRSNEVKSSGLMWRNDEAKSLYDKLGEMFKDNQRLIEETRRKSHQYGWEYNDTR